MTAMLIDGDYRGATIVEPAPTTRRPRRNARGDGLRPTAAPSRGIGAPQALNGATRHACVGERARVAEAAAPAWRLTNRGLAVVLVLVSMITLAAITVVGLTAFRVTSPSYQPYGQSTLQR